MDMDLFIGSSGTLIASAMESTGYYYQSFVLDALANPFYSSAGAFVYLVGVLVAIGSFIFSGEVKNAMWLLIAPGLFLTCVTIRTETIGSMWKFGANERDLDREIEEVDNILTKATGGQYTTTNYDAKISKVFGAYNHVISSVANQFVSVINSERENADIMFLVRDQIFASINFPMVHDRGFLDLLHAGFSENCREVIDTGTIMVDPLAESCDRCQAARTYNKIVYQPYPLTAAAYDYVATLFVDYPSLAQQAKDTGFSDPLCISDLVINACGGYGGKTCPGYGALLPSAEFNTCPQPLGIVPAMLTEFCTTYATRSGTLAQLADLSTGGLISNGLAEDAYDEFVEERQKLDGVYFTCPQIWSFTYVGLHRHAFEVYNNAIVTWETLRGRLNTLGWCSGFDPVSTEIFDLFARWVGASSSELSVNQIARRLFRRELEKPSISAVSAHYGMLGSTVNQVGVPMDSELSMTDRSRSSDPGWSERSRLLVAATTLPYYQGLGLFFLGVAFPFFAMLLLIPGKHSMFFLWFGLWAWLKSWDVAFSIVMLLSDVLYSLFVVNLDDLLNMFTRGLHPDLAVAVYSLREIDPGYDLSTYYHIVAVCMLSIPAATGYTILGSFKGGAGLIAQGGSIIPINPTSIWNQMRSKQSLLEMYENQSSQQSSQSSSSSSSAGSTSASGESGASSGGSSSLASQAITRSSPASTPYSDRVPTQDQQQRTPQQSVPRPIQANPSLVPPLAGRSRPSTAAIEAAARESIQLEGPSGEEEHIRLRMNPDESRVEVKVAEDVRQTPSDSSRWSVDDKYNKGSS